MTNSFNTPPIKTSQAVLVPYLQFSNEPWDKLTVDACDVFIQLAQGLMLGDQMRAQTNADFEDNLLHLRMCSGCPAPWNLDQVEKTVFWIGYTKLVRKQWKQSYGLETNKTEAKKIMAKIVSDSRFQETLQKADKMRKMFFSKPREERFSYLNDQTSEPELARIRANAWMAFYKKRAAISRHNEIGSPITERKRLLRSRSPQLQSKQHPYGYTPLCIELLSNCSSDDEREEVSSNIKEMSKLFKSIPKAAITEGGLKELSRGNNSMKHYTQHVFNYLNVEKPISQALISPRFQQDINTCELIIEGNSKSARSQGPMKENAKEKHRHSLGLKVRGKGTGSPKFSLKSIKDKK